MMHAVSRMLTIVCAIGAAACSKSNAASASTGGPDPASSSAGEVGGGTSAPAIDCNKVFVPADAAGIIAAPATVSADSLLGPGACHFVTAEGADLNVSVGSDENAQFEWHDFTATSDSKHYTPISGIGDSAVWRDASASGWLYAKKGGQYCKVELGMPGGSGAPKVHGVELAKQMGRLCTKLFAIKR